jgi:hypothetical protein
MTSFHVGFSTADKKAKCPFFQYSIIIYFHHTRIPVGCAIAILQQIHPILGAVPLHHYRKYTNGFIFFGSRYISFGSVDLFCSA